MADFTGRRKQVSLLCDLLAAADAGSGVLRVALVAGCGGLGKTSLAIHAAHRVRHVFEDGQLYVDLLGGTPSPLQPADVLGRFLREMGVDGKDVPLGEAERAARYRTSLAGRRVLVVLDNARDAPQVRPLLPGTGSCAVLVTTRNRMPGLAGSRLVDLDALDDDEALALFARVVGDERVAVEPEATAELLQACAGLPLAIHICAARLTSRSGWTIRSLANRVRDEHRRLDEMTVGDQAVRASFEVSFAGLPAVTRGIAPSDAFRLLGVWQGPTISTAAAAALFGAAEYDAADALELLVDAYLLESVGPDRYKFHDLLRVYASERAVADLSEDDRHTSIARLLSWYMRTGDAAATAVSPHRYNMTLEPAATEPAPLLFAAADEALAWYDSERSNVVAATRQAAGSGLHEIAWRMPATLFSFFHRRGNWVDCVATHRAAIESVRLTGDRQAEAWVLNNLGEALTRDRLDEATGYLERALSIRREIGDRRGEAQTTNNLADAYALLGRTEDAIELLRGALTLHRELGLRNYEGIALNNLSEIYLDLGRPADAIEHLQQARVIFAAIDAPHGGGYVLYNLGRAYLALGRDSEALDYLDQALAVYRDVGDWSMQAAALLVIGTAQSRVGYLDEARKSRSEALALFESLGDGAGAAEIRALLADGKGDLTSVSARAPVLGYASERVSLVSLEEKEPCPRSRSPLRSARSSARGPPAALAPRAACPPFCMATGRRPAT